MVINDRPVVVDFNVHRDAMVWPWWQLELQMMT
jgi:hypothetical protein